MMRIIADSFARGFQFSFETGAGFEHQHGVARAGGFFGERARRLAADFFIGVYLHHDFFARRARPFRARPAWRR